MSRSAAPATTSQYTLSKTAHQESKAGFVTALKRLWPLTAGERRSVRTAFIAILISSAAALLAPMIIGRTVDLYIRGGDFAGVLRSAALLLGIYICGFFSNYFQSASIPRLAWRHCCRRLTCASPRG